MTDEQAALTQQRHRGITLRHRLRPLGDELYDADAALLRQFNPFFPRFCGHMVGQNSLEYALLLLHSDDRVYGTDDAGEANRILRRILEHQVLDPDADSYGNFLWMTHWDRVKDANAVAFLVPGLIYAWLNFPEKLDDSTKAAMQRQFPAMLAGVHGRKIQWTYSNIFFLCMGALEGLARVLGDDATHQTAVRAFDEWLEGTARDGFYEFNSPTYTPVTLIGMEAALTYTTDDVFRERLRRTMDVYTYQLAQNLMPTGFLGGAASRAYQRDVLHGTGHAAPWAHVKLGTPLAIGPHDRLMFVNHTLYDYVPPPQVRALVVDRPDPMVICDRNSAMASRRTHVVTSSYGLASQCMERVGGHSPAAYVLMVRNTDAPRPSLAIVPDESFSHLPCASFQSRQSDSRVVGRLWYDLPDDQRDHFLEDPTFVCEPRVLFGLRDQIEEVRVGNVDWGGRPVQLRAGQSVAVSWGDLFVGLTLTLTDAEGEPREGKAQLAYDEDGELRLRVLLLGGTEMAPDDEPLQALLIFDTHVPAEGETLGDYAEWLSCWELSVEGECVAAQHPDESRMAYPHTDADPDPIGDALHVSPDLTLRPGDLTPIINGETSPAILAR